MIALAPRRAGKTVLVDSVTAHRCGQPTYASAWITAQSRDSAVKRWTESAGADDEKPSGLWHSPLRPLLTRPLRGVMNERLVWRGTGSKFLPFSPTEDAMHGEDPDLVWIDELWAHTAEDRRKIQSSYRPAWSVKPGQEWMISAAGTKRSGWLKYARQMGRAVVEADGRSRTAFFEWCVPAQIGDVPIAEVDDDDLLLQLVADNHPRRDHGLRRDYLRGELDDLGRLSFLRAYGGIDEDDAGVDTVIPQLAFRRAFSDVRIPAGVRFGLGVEVDPESREAAVSAAWRDPGSGQAVTQVLARQPGTRWLVPYVVERVANNDVGAVAVNNAGPARDAGDALEAAGVQLLRVSSTDYGAACTRYRESMTDVPVGGVPGVTHDGDADLIDALKAAGLRSLTSGKVWASATGEPVSVLVSHTLAVWAADHLPAETVTKFGWAAY